MLYDHCGDCYELLTDVRVLNTLANLLGGKWTVWVCAGCGHVEWFRNGLAWRIVGGVRGAELRLDSLSSVQLGYSLGPCSGSPAWP